jgi:hypothetical protein
MNWASVLRPSHDRRTAAEDVGAKALQRLQPVGSAQHEDAAVPEVAALGQVAPGGVGIGLLDEAPNHRPAPGLLESART